MSFPVLEKRAPAAAGSAESLAARHNADGGLLPVPPVVKHCTACEGSGLWQGIDGFVFVCQHCAYEMT